MSFEVKRVLIEENNLFPFKSFAMHVGLKASEQSLLLSKECDEMTDVKGPCQLKC